MSDPDPQPKLERRSSEEPLNEYNKSNIPKNRQFNSLFVLSGLTIAIAVTLVSVYLSSPVQKKIELKNAIESPV